MVIDKNQLENIVNEFLEQKESIDKKFKVIDDATRDCIFIYDNFIFKTNQFKEKEYYEKLNQYPWFPKCHHFYKDFLIYEFIKGQFLKNKFKDKKNYECLYFKTIEHIYELGKQGIVAYDLHDENIIVNDSNEIYFIDTGYFEYYKPNHKDIDQLINRAVIDFEIAHKRPI